jgi:hypothetical protein
VVEMSDDTKRLLQKINQYEFSKESDSIDIRKSSHWMKIYKEMQKIYMRLLEHPPHVLPKGKKMLSQSESHVEVSSKPISKEEMKQITDGSRFMSHEIGKDILRFRFQWSFICDSGEVILNTFSEKEKLTKSEMEEMNEMILVIFLIKDLFHRNEKYIQKVSFNGKEYLRAQVITMGGPNYEIKETISMNIISRQTEHTIEPNPITWKDLSGSTKYFYSTKFDFDVAKPNLIINTSYFDKEC